MSLQKTLAQFGSKILLILFTVGCKDQLVVKKIEIAKNMQIDTVEQYHNDTLLLVKVNVFFGPYGDFKTYCGVIRNFGSESIVYCADDLTPFRTSREYVAEINKEYFGKRNWGWYNIDKHGEMKSLPNEDKILDSLKALYGVTDSNVFGDSSPNVEMEIIPNDIKVSDTAKKYPSSDYFVSSNDNGFFWVNKNGKSINSYNYGNIVLKDSTINFDTLSYGLYKIVNSKLKMVSDNPNELYKKGEGIYYVPRPGIGVIRKYRIADIDSVLMSYHSLLDCPNTIRINASK